MKDIEFKMLQTRKYNSRKGFRARLALGLSVIAGVGTSFAGSWSVSVTDVIRNAMASELASGDYVDDKGVWGFSSGVNSLTPVSPFNFVVGTVSYGPYQGFVDKTKGASPRYRPYFLVGQDQADVVGPDGGTLGASEIAFHPQPGLKSRISYCCKDSGQYRVSLFARGAKKEGGDGVLFSLYKNGQKISESVQVTQSIAGKETGKIDVDGFDLLNYDVLMLEVDPLENTSADATFFTLQIEKTGECAEGPYSTRLISELDKARNQATPQNPCAGIHEGTWGYFRASGDARVLLVPNVQTTRVGPEAIGFAADTGTGYPYIWYNSSVAPVNYSGVVVAPGEVVAHPGGDGGDLVIRFTASKCARYSVKAIITDLQPGAGQGDVGGVGLSVRLPDTNETLLRVTANAMEPNAETAVVDAGSVVLNVGDSIDFVLDANGSQQYDLTKIDINLSLLSTSELSSASVLATDMRAEMQKDSPATDGFPASSGGKWAIGSCDMSSLLLPQGLLFSAFASVRGDHTGKSGFRGGFYSASVNYPHVIVNTDGVEAASGACGTLKVNEVGCHPHSSNAAVIRFEAPQMGVYEFSGGIHKASAGGDGIGVQLKVGAAACPVNMAFTDTARRPLRIRDVWLRKGETIDLIVGCGLNQDMSSDGGAVDLQVGSRVAEGMVINGKIGTNSYKGPGRMGFCSGNWNKISRQIQPASMERMYISDRSMRTDVSFSVDGFDQDVGQDVEATNGLLSDGVISRSPNEVRQFAFAGLEPETEYELCLYSSGAVPGMFSVGGLTRTTGMSWFSSKPDYTRLFVRSDADGRIQGRFFAATEGNALFCGFQLYAPNGFKQGEPNGLMLIVR